MTTRFLCILLMLVCLFGIVTAQTATIDFDNPTLSYSVVSKGMVTGIGCDEDNPCLIATASRHSSGQRVGILVTFPQVVSIQSITLDYSLDIANTSRGFRGGVWDVTIMDGSQSPFAGTVGTGLLFDGAWHTASTEDNTLFAREFWQPRAPFTGNSVLIQVRPVSTFHTGATIRIDNIVIEYTP